MTSGIERAYLKSLSRLFVAEAMRSAQKHAEVLPGTHARDFELPTLANGAQEFIEEIIDLIQQGFVKEMQDMSNRETPPVFKIVTAERKIQEYTGILIRPSWYPPSNAENCVYLLLQDGIYRIPRQEGFQGYEVNVIPFQSLAKREKLEGCEYLKMVGPVFNALGRQSALLEAHKAPLRRKQEDF